MSELSRLFDDHRFPLQLRLDVADVICGIRPAARVIFRLGLEADAGVRLLHDCGLALAVGSGFREQVEPVGYGYVDSFSDRLSESRVIRVIPIYVARGLELARAAKQADESQSDAEFGRSLGYPSCCVDAVIKRRQVPMLSECFSLYAPGGEYSPWLWPGALALDAPLSPHFPCSAVCNASAVMARARWDSVLASGNDTIADRLVAARQAVYWLTSDGIVRAGAALPENEQVLSLACPGTRFP